MPKIKAILSNKANDLLNALLEHEKDNYSEQLLQAKHALVWPAIRFMTFQVQLGVRHRLDPHLALHRYAVKKTPFVLF